MSSEKRTSTLQTVTELASNLRASVTSIDGESSSCERRESGSLSNKAGTRRVGGPGPTDVICARGKKALEHVGNKRFRAMVSGNMDTYSKAKTKLEKSLIVSHIIDQVRQASPPGGFIREDEETPGVWVEVGDAVAREKIGQGFRDLLHTQYRSSTKAKKRRRNESMNTNTPAAVAAEKITSASIRVPPRKRLSTKAVAAALATVPKPFVEPLPAARVSIEEQAADAFSAPAPKRRATFAPPRMAREQSIASVFDEVDEDVMEPVALPAPTSVAQHHASFHEVNEEDDVENDQAAAALLKRDSLFQKRDSLFAPHRLSAAQPNDVMSSIAALKSMLSPADLDLDHDNENDLDGGNVSFEPMADFMRHNKRPSIAQQRDSLRNSFSQRRSFNARTSFRAHSPMRPRLSKIFCMDQMPTFCKPDQALVGGEEGAANDFIQELNLQ